MKNLKYGLALSIVLSLFSCYSDESTMADGEINRIEITSPQRDSIYLYLGDPIVITPELTKGTASTYSWRIGEYETDYYDETIVESKLELVSTEKDFNFTPKDLGHYYVQFVATNEHGSTPHYYHVFVRGAYDEGFLVLGKKSDGTHNISFMSKLSPEELENGGVESFKQDAYSYVNGGEVLDGGIVDIDFVDESIFLTAAKSKQIIRINAKSFLKEYVYDFGSFKGDFEPLNFIGYDSKYFRSGALLSSNGGVLDIKVNDLEVFNHADYPADVKFVKSVDRVNWSSSVKNFAIDSENNLWIEGFDAVNMNFGVFSVDYFKNREIIGMFIDFEGNFVAINRDGATTKVTKIAGQGYSFSTMALDVMYDRELTTNSNLLTETAKYHHNDTYSSVFFGTGNKIYQWHYNQNEIPSTPITTLPDGEEIKHISSFAYEVDGDYRPASDETVIHVFTNNPSRGELSGSLYVCSTIDGSIIERHEGISSEPVVGFYKRK